MLSSNKEKIKSLFEVMKEYQCLAFSVLSVRYLILAQRVYAWSATV